MKKRVHKKPQAKPGTTKSAVTRTKLPRAAVAAATTPHDHLHRLLRGTYAHRACVHRQS